MPAATRVTVRQSAGDDGPRWQRYFALTERRLDRRPRDAQGLPRARVALPGEDDQAGPAVSRRRPTSSSSAAASSGRRRRGACARTASPAGSSSSSAIRTYARASSFLAMGGIRQQFALGGVRADGAAQRARCGATFDERMRTPSHTPRTWFRQRGYLFLADDANVDGARRARRRTGRRRCRAAAPERGRDPRARARPDARRHPLGPVRPRGRLRQPARGAVRAARRGARTPAPSTCTTRSSDVDGAVGGRVTGVRLARWRRLDAPVVVNAAGALSGRVARAGRTRRAGRAGAAAALPLHPAPAVADALPDGDRSGRRALAPRRPARRRRPRSHHRWRSPSGTNRPARASTATTSAGSTSSIRRWCAACRRWSTSPTSTAGPASTR